MPSFHQDDTTTDSDAVESDVVRLARCIEAGTGHLSEMLNLLGNFAKREDALSFRYAKKIAHYANSTESFYQAFVKIASNMKSPQSQEAMIWNDTMIHWVFNTICRSEGGKKKFQERMRVLFDDKENLPLELQSQTAMNRWQRLTASYGVSIGSGHSTPKDKLVNRAFKQFSDYLLRAQLLSTQVAVSTDTMNAGMKLAVGTTLKELHDNPGLFGLSANNSEGSGQLVAAFALKNTRPNVTQTQHYRNLVRLYSFFRGGALPAVEAMIKDHLRAEVFARWVKKGTDSTRRRCGPVLFR